MAKAAKQVNLLPAVKSATVLTTKLKIITNIIDNGAIENRNTINKLELIV